MAPPWAQQRRRRHDASCCRVVGGGAAAALLPLLLLALALAPTADAAAATAGGTRLLPDVSASGACKEEARTLCAHVFEKKEQQEDEPQKQQQQQQQQEGQEGSGDGNRRRRLLDDADTDTETTTTETTTSEDQKALQKVAELLRVPYPVTDRAALQVASPLARCLKKALHDEQYGSTSSTAAAPVSDACANDVRSFYVGRAADPARDPSLLEACAREALELCSPSLSVKGGGGGAGGAAASSAPEPLVTCLSRRKLDARFGARCERAVGLRQQEMAEDVALDPALLAACVDDLKALCPSAMAAGAWRQDASGARVCLERIAVSSASAASSTNEKQQKQGDGDGATATTTSPPIRRLSKRCASALFSRMARDAEDIRYHYRLSAACASDAARHCQGVKPGNHRVVDCLEDARHSADFSPQCAAALADSMLLRASDARLDWPLRKSCERDADRFCFGSAPEAVAAAFDDGDNASSSSSILRDVRFARAQPGEAFNITGCLRRHVDQLEYDSCRAAVRRRAVQAYEDSTLDPELLVSCGRNVTDNCPDARRALPCLKDLLRQGAALAASCRAVLAARLREASGDLRYIPEVARECRAERARFCAGVGEGAEAGGGGSGDGGEEEKARRAYDAGGRFGGSLSGDGAAADVLDCLADFAQEVGAIAGSSPSSSAASSSTTTAQFGEACRAALNDHLALAVEDVRQMRSLSRHCSQDRARLCPGVIPGRGRVVACLQDNRARVQEPQCRRQLLRLMGLAAGDYRLDYALREACEADVRQRCPHVRPGGGRVHTCLRQNEQELSAACLKQVRRFEAAEHGDIRLNPELGAACAGAAALFCSRVAPGEASVISCLRETAAAAEAAQGGRAAGVARWWDGVLTGAGVRWDSAPSLAMSVTEAGMMAEAGVGAAADAAKEEEDDKGGQKEEKGEDGAAATATAPSTAAAFPPACRRALRKQLHRAATRLSFNPRLHAACREDLARHCPKTAEALFSPAEQQPGPPPPPAEASDAAANGTAAAAAASAAPPPLLLTRDDHDRAAMDCLGRTEAELSPDCGAALGESTRMLLHDYVPGASLTSPCDPDAARLCGASRDTAPLMEPGSVRGCLVRHLHDLGRECWSLVSRVEPGAARDRAERVEALLFDPEAEQALEAAAKAGGKKDKEGKGKKMTKKEKEAAAAAAAAAVVVGEIARHADSRGADGLDAALRKALRSAGVDTSEAAGGGGHPVLYSALLQALASTDEARRAQREAGVVGPRGRGGAGSSASARQQRGGPPPWLLWSSVAAAVLTAAVGAVLLARYAQRMRTMLRGGQIVYKDGRA
jgi:hypothetical protein